MLLKENIINHIFLVGIIKGIAEGFYYFSKNIIDTEKIDNQGRQKFNGLLKSVNKLIAIIIPLILGVLLTFFSYVDLGKIFFLLFVIMFLVSFYIQDGVYFSSKINMKSFKKNIKEKPYLKKNSDDSTSFRAYLFFWVYEFSYYIV